VRRLVPALLAGALLLVGVGPTPVAVAAPAPTVAAELVVTDRQVERHADRDLVRMAERLSDGSVQVRTIFEGRSSTEHLGGRVVGAPAVLQPHADGIATQLFARGVDDRLWVNEQFYDDSWSGWRRTEGVVTGRLGVTNGPNGDGFDLYARGGDGALWHLRSGTTRGYGRAWARIGGKVAPGTGPAPSHARNGWDVVVQGTDGKVWRSSWTYTTGRWSGFTGLGGRITDSPAMGFTVTEHVLVARGTTGIPYLRTGSAGWRSLGGAVVGSPMVAWSPGDPVARVYATGTDGRLYRGTYGTRNSVWSGWSRTG
jgi:hypothetical protein